MVVYIPPLSGIPHDDISSYSDETHRVGPYHILNHKICPAGGMGYYSFAREKCDKKGGM